MKASDKNALSKVPAVTLAFWIVKIIATTLGETGGDAVSMSMNLGYIVASLIFAAIFAVVVVLQVKAKTFHPYLYWSVVVATTTLGTTLADFADRSLGIGYTGGSFLLVVLLMGSLYAWYKSAGSVSVNTVTSPKVEAFYWVTILFSQTLGTALGDWVADTNGFGYERGALIFGAGLGLIAAAYYFTNLSRTLLFWAAFILTRPLGATLGDLLDKPVDHGGLAFSRYTASAILLALMVAFVSFLPKKAEDSSPPTGKKSEAMKTPLITSLNFLVIQAALAAALSDFAIESFQARNFVFGIAEMILLTINLWGAQKSYLSIRTVIERK